ncbi:MAG: CsbD family protein [Ramlibacter sp.]
MKADQVKGKLKEAAGETQEHLGRVTGDKEQEAKGHAHEQEGKIQKKVGDVKDAADKIVRKP